MFGFTPDCHYRAICQQSGSGPRRMQACAPIGRAPRKQAPRLWGQDPKNRDGGANNWGDASGRPGHRELTALRHLFDNSMDCPSASAAMVSCHSQSSRYSLL